MFLLSEPMMLFLTIGLMAAQVCQGNVGKWNVFSTKTAYSWAHDTPEPPIDEGTHKSVNNKLCKVIQVSIVARHGARYPTISATEDIEDLREHLLKFDNSPRFQDISAWVSSYPREKSGELAPVGEKEQFGLGRRNALKFQTLFQNSGQYVKFVSSSKARALDSSVNFYNGMRTLVPNIRRYKNEVNNSITRFWDGCENYEEQVDDNDDHFEEFADYEETPEFKTIVKAVTARFGLDSLLSPDDIYLIYELCAYDRYVLDKISFWCDLLTDEEREVLEYGQDIEKYYESAYGHPINGKVGCPLVSDIFQTMDRAINDTWNYDRLPPEAKDMGYLAGVFRFGHSQTVVHLMTSLGLFKDDMPLLARNRAALAGRKFKTSEIIPFSGNVAFALYACDELAHSVTNAERKFMVQLHVNEQAIKIPGCEAIMCPYEQARKMFSDLIDKCNIKKICEEDDEPSGSIRCTSNAAVLVWLTVMASLYRTVS